MKKSVVAFLLSSALVSPLAMAQVNLPEGLQEFGLQGSLDLADDDYSFVSNISYGYFIMDDWEVGGVLEADLTEDSKTFQFGVFTEYNFTNYSQWVPYVGAAAQFASLNVSGGDLNINAGSDDAQNTGHNKINNSALNIKLSGGVKYFLNPQVAISAEVNYNISTEKVRLSKGKLKDSFTKIVFGTRFYF